VELQPAAGVQVVERVGVVVADALAAAVVKAPQVELEEGSELPVEVVELEEVVGAAGAVEVAERLQLRVIVEPTVVK
jgi:hypothetical protein